jgi:hypothetical protein
MMRCTARDPYADSRGYGDRCVLESDNHVAHVDAFGETFDLEPSESEPPKDGPDYRCGAAQAAAEPSVSGSDRA